MKRLLLICMILAAMLAGCSHNHFNVPAENFASKVKALGIAPIMIDRESDIRHPEKEQLITLLAETNRKNEMHFARRLKTTGNFYTVAFLDGDPQSVFSRLFFRREIRDDATIQYNKYFWKNEELNNYIRKNNLDAVMLIVVSGLTKKDKVSSIPLMKSMSGDYNHLIMTAQILDANGTVLWEYPNFRQRILSYDTILNLEYPDFSEAEANLSAVPNVKFRTIDGVRRILEQRRKDMLLRDTPESGIYGKQFDDMFSLLKYDQDKEKSAPQPVTTGQPRPLTAPEQPLEQPAMRPPVRPIPQTETAPGASAAPLYDPPPLPPAEEVVPAAGSTL